MKTPREAFSLIYARGIWGKSESEEFYSGSGSHDPEIVSPYVSATGVFLRLLARNPNAVDLGCGDFHVGKQLRQWCNQYVACDVVPELIETNTRKFSNYHVDFRCLDIVEDPLPDGEIAFIRQVFQHLNNAQVLKVINKLGKFRYLIVTEHLPSKEFVPNIDTPMGAGIRLTGGQEASGIVLTCPPFNLRARSEQVICEVRKSESIVRTIIYEMQ